jgi:hypothetical protein
MAKANKFAQRSLYARFINQLADSFLAHLKYAGLNKTFALKNLSLIVLIVQIFLYAVF